MINKMKTPMRLRCNPKSGRRKKKVVGMRKTLSRCVIHTKQRLLRLLCLTLSQREQRSNVRDVLQAFEQRDEVQEFVVGGVADPAFDWDGVV
jgi:hypothetical protein